MRIDAKLRCYDAHSDYIYIILLQQICRPYTLNITTQSQRPYVRVKLPVEIYSWCGCISCQINAPCVGEGRAIVAPNQLVNINKSPHNVLTFDVDFAEVALKMTKNISLFSFDNCGYVWCRDKLRCRRWHTGRSRNHLCSLSMLFHCFAQHFQFKPMIKFCKHRAALELPVCGKRITRTKNAFIITFQVNSPFITLYSFSQFHWLQ